MANCTKCGKENDAVGGLTDALDQRIFCYGKDPCHAGRLYRKEAGKQDFILLRGPSRNKIKFRRSHPGCFRRRRHPEASGRSGQPSPGCFSVPRYPRPAASARRKERKKTLSLGLVPLRKRTRVI